MDRHPDQTRRRLAQTASRLRSLVYPETVAPREILVSEAAGRIGWRAARRLGYRPAVPGETFGPLWATYWFRVVAEIPGHWAGRRVDFLWDSGSEATLWRDGTAVQGLNAGWRARRTSAVVTDLAPPGGERLELDVEMACNSWMGEERPAATLADPFGEPRWRIGGTWSEPTSDGAAIAPPEHARLERCGLALFDQEAWDLARDFDALRGLEAEHGRGLDPAWAGELLRRLNDFCNLWKPADRATWAGVRPLLAALLEHTNGTRTHSIHALGHAHLDTAWLWPIEESRRKVIRIAANQLALMDRYPEYRFAASSAQHYLWLEQDAPDLYARVAERIAEGRWDVVGGAWVEPDCNLPSGESIVRHLLYGQRFFERRFGRRCREFWSPDTFGHGGQLPQILRQAGIDRFLTQKLSWNQFTTPLYHSFRWQGIDGSEVLAHMPPADTYNAEMTIEELRASAANAKDHDRTSASLQLFGYGDGGGGPTPEMLELARRVGNLQGVPTVELASSGTFFDRLDAELGDDAPTIVGELYLEAHRGTYTSQAATKRGNRQGERLLGEAEAAAALADRIAGAPYPRRQLEDLWRLLLLHQFHDILPGSSIRAVYEDAARDHAAIATGAREIRDAALAVLTEPGQGPAPVNLTPFPRLEVADRAGSPVLVEAPAFGFGAIVADAPDSVGVERAGEMITLENGVLRATLDERGLLTSLVERATGREALTARGNRFELYEDLPTAYDAWEIEPYHAETRRSCPGAERCEIISDGPLRAEIAFSHRIGRASRIRQIVRLDACARRLEFLTTVDWHERHRLLKVVFPVRVRSTRATYETQFGVHERPTHRSTAADLARFEVPGHRFVDVGEHAFGVALLTDSTYGYSTAANELRLSLLRAPTDPDPHADQGRHEFAYAIYPHAGTWQEASVVAEARLLGSPIRWVEGAARPGSFASVEGGLVLDTIKREEDGNCLVLRLYEPHGGRGVARIRLGLPFRQARLANLLEDAGGLLPVHDGEIVIAFESFQIHTVVVE